MYALFPNEARQDLSAHQEGAEKAVFLMSEELHTVREDEAVDVGQIRELIKVIEASDVSEVVIEEGDTKITVRRGFVAAAPAAPAAAAPSAAAAPAAADSESLGSVGSRPASWKTVIAPMVGTFYAAASPGTPDFVSAGDSFEEGATLCILEAMKLMNEIVAEEAGEIREVAVSNGDSVEYGTVLFYYEAS